MAVISENKGVLCLDREARCHKGLKKMTGPSIQELDLEGWSADLYQGLMKASIMLMGNLQPP